jgi:hypothetical protein
MLIDTKRIDWYSIFSFLYLVAATAFVGWYARTDLTLKKEQVIAERRLVEDTDKLVQIGAIEDEILMGTLSPKKHAAPPTDEEQDGLIEPEPGRGKTTERL